jgi:hypothetical protein
MTMIDGLWLAGPAIGRLGRSAVTDDLMRIYTNITPNGKLRSPCFDVIMDRGKPGGAGRNPIYGKRCSTHYPGSPCLPPHDCLELN